MYAVIFALAFISTPEREPVSFAYFGCNRVSDKVEKAQAKENPSSANVSELLATFRDVSALKPKLLFALGDIVNGYADDDGTHLRHQLQAWEKLVKLDPAVGLVVAPGNHELNKKTKAGKFANLAADSVWAEWARRNNFDTFAGNGPTPENDPDDKLVDDQRRLSYSFTIGTTHFVVLNTDTRTSVKVPGSEETRVGWVPAAWLAADLARADKDPSVLDVFVLGHRNLVPPVNSSEDAPIDPDCAKAMVQSVAASTKFRGYLCSHVHAFDVAPIPGTSAKQVVLGNGGSDLNKDWKPNDSTWFGFAMFNVKADGQIEVQTYRRPAPEDSAPVDAKVAPSRPGAVIKLN